MDTILKAGMAAPVWSGQYDSLHLTVIQNMELLNEIGDKVTELVQKMLEKKLDKNFGAPTMVLVSAKPGHLPGIEYANAACVLENMALAATDMGIDNILWGGAAVVVSQDESLRGRLGIPEGFTPVLCASFGYGAAKEAAKQQAALLFFRGQPVVILSSPVGNSFALRQVKSTNGSMDEIPVLW